MVVAALICACGTTFAAPPAADAGVIWTRVIARDGYIGWPSVCKRANGELVAVFSGDRNWHICPWGKVRMVRSSDGGETWTQPETVQNSINDDRDAGITELANGDLMLTWFSSIAYLDEDKANRNPQYKNDYPQYRRHFFKLPREQIRSELGYFTKRSGDGGKTWEKPVRTDGSAPHGGIHLRDGRLLMVGRRLNFGWLPEDNAKHPFALTVEESRDCGRTWHLLTVLEKPAAGDRIGNYHEPHVVEAADGTLIAQFRIFGGKDVCLRQCESRDGGKTWSQMHVTPICGYPPHLIALDDGRILCSYAKREGDAFGEYACLSHDNGKTWDIAHEIRLSTAWNNDIGYPASVQLDDGSIVTVYYQSPREGEKPCLMATKWRLNAGNRCFSAPPFRL